MADCSPGRAEGRSTWYLPASASHEIASRDLLHIALAFGARLGIGRDPVLGFGVIGRLVEPLAPPAFEQDTPNQMSTWRSRQRTDDFELLHEVSSGH